MQEREADYLADEETNYADMRRREEEQQYEATINLTSLQPSPATTEQIANDIVTSILEGKVNPLEFVVKKKCITDALDMALKNEEVKKMCITEVEKYGKEGATCLGAKVTLTTKRTYKYEADPKWRELNQSIAEASAQIKAQEEKIKVACKTNSSLVDQETGEVIASVVPAPETTSIAVSFKK